MLLPAELWLEIAARLGVEDAARLSRATVAARDASAHRQSLLRAACRVGGWAWLWTRDFGGMVVRLERVDGTTGELVGTRRGLVGQTDAEVARQRARTFRFSRPRILALEPETAHAGLPAPSRQEVTVDRWGNLTMTMHVEIGPPTDADTNDEPPMPSALAELLEAMVLRQAGDPATQNSPLPNKK